MGQLNDVLSAAGPVVALIDPVTGAVIGVAQCGMSVYEAVKTLSVPGVYGLSA